MKFPRILRPKLRHSNLKQLLRPEPSALLVKLGSDYGGWVFEQADYLYGCSVISAGAGEDISWEVEFSQVYDAQMLILDPTPRAFEHFLGVQEIIGSRRGQGYSLSGHQPYSSYPLERLTSSRLTFQRFALAGVTGTGTFFLPADQNHVSGQLSTQVDDGEIPGRQKILVETVVLRDLIQSLGSAQLLKMDIEGSELDVLESSLDVLSSVRQILVEFDSLRKLSRKTVERIKSLNTKLVALGFVCRFVGGGYNALFVRVNY